MNPYNTKEIIEKYLEKSPDDYDSDAAFIIENTCISDSILELGFANGYLLRLLHEKGYMSLSGLDLSRDFIYVFHKSFPEIPVYHMDLTEEILGEKYDVIIANHFLTSIPDEDKREKAIHNICKMLKDDGKVFVKTFFADKTFDITTNQNGVEIRIHLPEKSDFSYLLSRYGLELKQFNKYQKGDFPVAYWLFEKKLREI